MKEQEKAEAAERKAWGPDKDRRRSGPRKPDEWRASQEALAKASQAVFARYDSMRAANRRLASLREQVPA